MPPNLWVPKIFVFSTKVMYILHTFLAGAQIFQWSIYIAVVPGIVDVKCNPENISSGDDMRIRSGLFCFVVIREEASSTL